MLGGLLLPGTGPRSPAGGRGLGSLTGVSTLDSAARAGQSRRLVKLFPGTTDCLSVPPAAGMAVEDTVAAKLVYDSWSSAR